MRSAGLRARTRQTATTEFLFELLTSVRPPDAERGGATHCGSGRGYPVVVRPQRRSGRAGVSGCLNSDEMVISAYRIANRYDREVIVERHVPGDTYRLLVVSGQVVATCRLFLPTTLSEKWETICVNPDDIGEAVKTTAIRAVACCVRDC